MERIILHCDLNAFFASVELKEHPEFRGKPVAVCGSQEDRHGIVLAKSEEAKRCGIITGEVIWQAKNKCRDLIIIPPHYELYIKYSEEVRKIYYRYTDMVESFGIDECWLDVTGSTGLFGSGREIAYSIKETVKRETGLTISVGVSFNKVFAKLGSDIKKPDAVTEITKEGFKDQIWQLPVGTMLGVGYATQKALAKYGVWTIGQLARLDVNFCRRLFGKVGAGLWVMANGLDNNRVALYNDYAPVKSVGHGNTAREDLENSEEVRLMIMELSQDVARRLRLSHLAAKKVQITIKDNTLSSRDVQGPLDYPSQSFIEISGAAYRLFCRNYNWEKKIRALTVRGIDLIKEDEAYQLDLFCNVAERERQDIRETTMEKIRRRYGNRAIEIAALLGREKIPLDDETVFNSMPVRHNAL